VSVHGPVGLRSVKPGVGEAGWTRVVRPADAVEVGVAPPYPAGRVSSQETACAARPAHNEPNRAAKLLGRPPGTDGVS